MNVEEFVAETLIQIVKGVVRAQRDTHHLGARIYPLMRAYSGPNGPIPGEDSDANARPTYNVSFDMALTVSNAAGSSAGLKAGIHVLEADLGGGSSKANTSVSRVSFTLPIVYPVHSGWREEWGPESVAKGVSPGESV